MVEWVKENKILALIACIIAASVLSQLLAG